MSENKITIGIKIPLNKSISQSNTIIRVENYSYFSSDEVGLGYISHVYLGRNDESGELVAIKVIDFSKEDQLGQQLVEEELNILETIKKHNPRHLLLLQDHFKIKKKLYIVTEFCEGKDVAKLLRKKKLLSEKEAQSIMKQLILAYRELYQMKIIHRDLKLANVLIKQGRLKLADFGFSIQVEKYSQQKGSYNVGSPNYMPPETLKFNQYSFSSDIWALGVMAYQIVYGRLPFKEKVESILYDKIMATNIEDLFDPSIIISEHYRSFIKSCLQQQIQRRASPQFVIQFSWPFAIDNIEGLKAQPGSRPLSIHQQFGPLTHRKIATQYFISEPVSNRNSISKFQPLGEKSPNCLNKNGSTVSIRESARLQNNRISVKLGDSFKVIERVIVSQIHYCQFISSIHEMVNHYAGVNLMSLSIIIQEILAMKIQQIRRFEQGCDGMLSQLPYVKEYKQTTSWARLKIILRQFQQTNTRDPSQKSSHLYVEYLKQIIGELKFNTPVHFHLLQSLTYLYQLTLLERQGLDSFAAQSKVSLLANRTAPNSQVASRQLCERLEKRLSFLDL